MSRKKKEIPEIIGVQNHSRKANFILAIAKFLCENAATKSIELQMGKPHAKEWAALRNASPIFGNVTVEEAEQTLQEFFR